MIPKSTVDQIINTARIDEVVGDFVVLKKRGVNLMACCPFHGEKTPSFSVSVTKGIYKCFGCGRAGNAVNFIMEHESMNYVEALRFLAKKYNIEIVEENINPEEAKALNTERESIHIALNFAARYFHNTLLETEEGKTIGLSYFKERGFRTETLEKFQLGYSPEGRTHFYDAAIKSGLTREFIVKAGLVSELENGDVIDRYRGRVIFPIYNLSGKIIAFAGRVLKTSDRTAKYVNSPETAVYHKSEHLYGLHLAKTSIKKNDIVYLVEGYTDVITLVQSGVENVVASSGTSLTEQQIRLVSRFTKNITVLYDGDPAGIKAALRGIDMLLLEGMNVKVVLFPDNDDPDSYCRKVGGTAFEEYIAAHAKDFIVFKSELLYDEVKNDVAQRAGAIHSIVESISKIPDPITRSLYASESSKILHVDEQLILSEIVSLRHSKNRENQQQVNVQLQQAQEILNKAAQEEKLNGNENYETGLMRLILKFGNLPYNDEQTVMQFMTHDLDDVEIVMDNPAFNKILDVIRAADNRMIDTEQLFQHEDPEISQTAINLIFDQDKYKTNEQWLTKYDIFIVTPEMNYKTQLEKLYAHLKIEKIGKHYKAILEELKDVGSLPESEQEAKTNEIQHLFWKLKKIESDLSVVTGTTVMRYDK